MVHLILSLEYNYDYMNSMMKSGHENIFFKK